MKELKNLITFTKLLAVMLLSLSLVHAEERFSLPSSTLTANNVADPIGNESTQSGSSLFQECTELTNLAWEMGQVKAASDSTMWSGAWKQLYKKHDQIIKNISKPEGLDTINGSLLFNSGSIPNFPGTSKRTITVTNTTNENGEVSSSTETSEPDQSSEGNLVLTVRNFNGKALVSFQDGNKKYYLDARTPATTTKENLIRHSFKKSEVEDLLEEVRSTAFEALKEGIELRKKLEQCTAYLALTKDSGYIDYSEVDHTKRGGKESSFDGKITCKTEGAETQDYPACVDMIFAYNAATVGKTALHTGQQIQMQEHAFDAQANLDPNDPTSTFKVQEDSLDKQAEISYTRSAFNIAKAGTLFTLLQKMPDDEDLQNKCHQVNMSNLHNKIRQDHGLYHQAIIGSSPSQNITAPGSDSYLAQFTGLFQVTSTAYSNEEAITDYSSRDIEATIPMQMLNPTIADEDSSKVAQENCDQIISQDNVLTQNEKAMNAVKKLMVDAGIESLADIAKAEILKNQADKIGDAADKIKKFEPVDITFQPGDDLFAFCQANPSADECLNIDTSRTVGFGGGEGITIGTLGSAQTDAGRLTGGDSSVDTATSAGGPTDRSNVSGGLGSALDPINKNTGFETAPPGAANVKQNAVAGGGGGGGSGGGGAASGGGGGGGAARGAPTAGKRVSTGKGVKFGAAGNGSLRFGGGGRKLASRQKGKGNPFSKLFGKKGAKRGGTLNFRNPASIGKKKDSIFGMISNRYNKVSKNKRLLEYETKK